LTEPYFVEIRFTICRLAHETSPDGSANPAGQHINRRVELVVGLPYR
jgi:hypothetical protein